MSSDTMKCDHCKGTFPYPHEILRYQNGIFCKECAKTFLQRCSQCKRRVPPEHTIEFNGSTVCHACAVTLQIRKCPVCKTFHDTVPSQEHIRFMKEIGITKYSKNWCPSCEAKATANIDIDNPVPCTFCKTPTIKDQPRSVISGFNTEIGEYTYSPAPKDTPVCKSCDSSIYWCKHCNKYHHVNVHRIYVDIDGISTICHKSWAKHYFRCTMCNQTHGLDARSTISNTICTACAKDIILCEHCERPTLLSNVIQSEGLSICQRCARNLGTCDSCKKQSLTTASTYEDNSLYLCKTCRHATGKATRWNWRHRPKFIPHTLPDEKNPILIGIENEISANHKTKVVNDYDLANQVTKLYSEDLVYIMYDGTIDYGFEIVTHPMSYEFFKTLNLNAIVPKGTVESKTTGMHIHISRTAFTEYSLYLFMRFISTNPVFITAIAGRSPGGAHQWALTPEGEVVEKAKGRRGHSKYVDVNIDHRESIEIRIFKGATETDQVLRNVQFVYSLAQYCNTTDPKLTLNHYSNWLSSQKEFTTLQSYVLTQSLHLKTPGQAYHKPLTQAEFEGSSSSYKEKKTVLRPYRASFSEEITIPTSETSTMRWSA